MTFEVACCAERLFFVLITEFTFEKMLVQFFIDNQIQVGQEGADISCDEQSTNAPIFY